MRGPEALVFAVADVESEDFPASVCGDAEGDHDRLGHDAVPDAGLAVGRVQEHIRVIHGREVPVPERTDFVVQVLADPGHLGLGDPGIGPERLDQVIDLAGGDTVQVGLHHDRVEGLVHAAAAFEQGREERSVPQLGDFQVQVPGGGRQRPGPGPVALGGPCFGAFERGGADERGRLRFDELLVQGFGRGTDPVGDIGEFQLAKEVKQGRLV
ncbi:hypothetical protein BJG92_03629 [Arthrobacter sp. SO5]|nr:hypothetical protein [Arthrobacter sp. SO5]